jgi:hypothetical protein
MIAGQFLICEGITLMAVQSKSNVATKSGMRDRISTNVARDGAAKRPQTSFAVKGGMKDQNSFAGAGPANPGSGPDAGSPNVLDPTKVGKKVQTTFPAKWGMTDGHGEANCYGGKAVLSEASLLK